MCHCGDGTATEDDCAVDKYCYATASSGSRCKKDMEDNTSLV